MGSNIIKSGIKTLAIQDGEENVIQSLQVQLYEAIKNCGKLGQYGLYGNAPKGSFVILMQVNGQEEVLYGIEDDVNNRPRGLKEGEVMLYNTLTQNYVYFTAEGRTQIYVKTDMNIKVEGNVNITAQTTTVNGNAVVNGNTTMNGDLSVSGTMSAGVVEAGNGTDGTFTNSVTSTKGIVTAGN